MKMNMGRYDHSCWVWIYGFSIGVWVGWDWMGWDGMDEQNRLSLRMYIETLIQIAWILCA